MNNSTTFQGDGKVAYIPVVINGKQARRTNGDNFRAMSDEELAELWWKKIDCGECPLNKDCLLTEVDCIERTTTWLRQECAE